MRPSTVQRFYAILAEAGVGERTRVLVHAVLHCALENAVRLGLVPRNVCDAVTKPRYTPRETKWWTTEEAGTFLRAAKSDRFYGFYVVAITTGLRLGELLALKWQDIDLKEGRLQVRRTVDDSTGHLELGVPKTKMSRRSVALSQFAVVALQEHRKRMFAEGHAREWVFCNTRGALMRANNLRRSYKRLLAAAGVREIRLHELRHTHATACMLGKIPPRVTQERLGHSGVGITLALYSHVAPGLQQEAADLMDRMFGELA